jgi:PPOX class probable F420-dependent enzyme
MLASARVARLATVDAAGRPAIVPFCLALIEDAGSGSVIVSVLDDKPKRVADTELARVRNIARNPSVAVLIDHYEEDWSRLAFVHVRGTASLLGPGDSGHAAAIAALRGKYPQYRAMAIEARPVIRIGALRATSWGALPK